MRRIICIFLSAIMCMSAVVATPIEAIGVEAAQEITANEAKESYDSTLLSQETGLVKSLFYEFENFDAIGGIKNNITVLSTENGVMEFETVNNDPRLTFPVEFYADDYDSIKLRMKWEAEAADDVSSVMVKLFYMGTDADGNKVTIKEAYSIKVYDELSSNGEYKIITLPLTNENLAGMKITKLALDPIDTNGTVSLDYLMAVSKNDRVNMEWHFNTDGDKEGWGTDASNGVVANGSFSATTKRTSNTVYKEVNMYKGSDYPIGYVRLMVENLSEDKRTLFYTNLCDASGTQIKNWSSPYPSREDNQYGSIKATVPATENGNYNVYAYNFGEKAPYADNYITEYYYNVESFEEGGTNFSIDYVIFPHKNHFEWDFETEGYLGGLTISHADKMLLEDGYIRYDSNPEDEYVNTTVELKGLNIDADKWAGAEIVMKHNVFTASPANKVQIYYSGTTATGESFSYKEANSAKVSISDDKLSTGEGSTLYYIDFQSSSNWSGSTIKKLRLDPLKTAGSYEIDYIRLVPTPEGFNEPLDETELSLGYEFEDQKAGTADGKVSIDFGNQIADSAEKIVLYWASGNETDGYTALSDFTAIKTLSGAHASLGYTINKDMLIPVGATALIAEVTDCEKTFTLAFDIPESKLNTHTGDPLYTIGLTGDIHIGGFGSETAPSERLLAIRDEFCELSDFVVVDGDITQWYGAYSGKEFRAYNYNGSTYSDNGERSPEYLGTGSSQWTVLEDYFKGFTVPVYAVQGNHDIKDKPIYSPMIESEKYWRPFLENWVAYSNTAENGSKYLNTVTLDDSENYYDTEVFGTHLIFTEIPRSEDPNYTFSEEQLKWLDMKLYEKEESGKPIFVFGHVPLETQINGSWCDDYFDDTAVKAVLAKHPTAIYLSGHTHFSLDVDLLSSIDGKQETTSYVHVGGGSTIYILNDDNDKNPDNSTEIEESHVVFAKVYDDVIELWGRDVTNGKWISRGCTYLTLKEECTIDDIELNKALSGDSYVLTANVPENVNATWILDGQDGGTESTVTVAKDFDGYIAVRYTDANGAYRSEVFSSLEEVPETLDVTPTSYNISSIRTNSDSGIRFMASVTNRQKEAVTEYGFIVTLEKLLSDKELTHSSGVVYAEGVNYRKDEVDIVYNTDENNVFFTAAIYGVPKTKQAYTENFVARPFTKTGDTYTYGTPVVRSILSVAMAIRDKNYENLDEDTISSVKAILTICDESTEPQVQA